MWTETEQAGHLLRCAHLYIIIIILSYIIIFFNKQAVKIRDARWCNLVVRVVKSETLRSLGYSPQYVLSGVSSYAPLSDKSDFEAPKDLKHYQCKTS